MTPGTKFIVVYGGVISGVGKGSTVAAIGKILQEYGFSVTAIKIDPYINYDAGTLRPTEHGEVWVTDDGGETDQDLGNYERILNVDLPRINNITTGQIYSAIIEKERRGEFLGQTVQFIPHVPDEIKRRLKFAAEGKDFAIVEIGGTIGDYENLPFIFAAKSLEVELGKDSVAHVLVTYMPVPAHIGEMKTKPTQQAIRMLNEAGIFPDFVLCRSSEALDEVRKKKVEVYANIPFDNIISEPDIKTIYKIPLDLEKEGFGKKLLKKFGTQPKKEAKWEKMQLYVRRIESPKKRVRIAIVGKYIDVGNFTLLDSYISIKNSLEHAAAHLDIGADIEWIDSKKLERSADLSQYKGLIIPGGFGSMGVEGKINAIKFARQNSLPFLGLCYGLQLAVVEFARNVCDLSGAHTTEIDAKTKSPVIDLLPTQKQIMRENMYGGTMRLGAYVAALDNSQVLEMYRKSGRLKRDSERIKALLSDKNQQHRLGITKGKNLVLERHRHRYEVNPKFVKTIEKGGLKFSGFHVRSDRTPLMEFIELPKHRFFVATQAHPEFKSRLDDPSPLFLEFVRACAE